MNIQIFGKNKCFDTKKAERYFKERGIPFQKIDLVRYGMSDGEFASVKRALGGIEPMLDKDGKAYEKHYIAYLAEPAAVEEKMLEYPELIRTPIVRNGRQATVGYAPEIWKEWK